MGPTATILPCGKRLHLQHGPIDLIIGADGDRSGAFAAAEARFATVLIELIQELPELKRPLTPALQAPSGQIALRMDRAARPYCADTYVTRMAGIAGSVADSVLEAMKSVELTRAFVNNGGDIAVHLTPEQSFTLAMSGHDGRELGRVLLRQQDAICGIATSGRHGRSHSLGIADSVTVLAPTAAAADVAATLIANAVDVPDHPGICRKPALEIDDATDLGNLPIVTHVGQLSATHVSNALARGRTLASDYIAAGHISGAALFLRDQSETTCPAQLSITQRSPTNA